ncbi:MAG TPA: carbohydrate ABC transporter permease [Aestuariivirga sp.]|nr:carbohydrate ABC transporter permease [Aestuariivirga sp.]
MSEASFKLEKANRSLMERLFEPPAVGKMSPVANLVAYLLLFVWSIFVLFPLYWVVITSFKDAAAVNQGPYYIPFVDFQPNLNAWRAQFNTDPFCDMPSILRQVGLLFHNSFAFLVSPVMTIQPMEPQICKIYLAFTNSIVVSVAATIVCVTIGSMAAYALARVQYKPKFGNIMMFVALTVLVIAATSYAGVPWWASTAVALALFFFLARAFGKYFTRTLANGDILFWIISQRILPPIVVIIPIYVMFQAVGLLDTHLALITVYAVANLPIVVWLMYDFFSSLPIELEESAQLDGATRFGIFWEIVLPLTRPGLAATTLLTLILSWNEYLFAVFLSTSKVQTMPIMVQAKNAGEKGVFWWEMCAIIVVMIVPVIIMAIILQRFIARGVLLGAVKG